MRINQKVVIGLSRVGQTLINQTEGCNEQFPGFCRISGGIATWHSFESYTWNLLSLTRIQSNVVSSGCIWPEGRWGQCPSLLSPHIAQRDVTTHLTHCWLDVPPLCALCGSRSLTEGWGSVPVSPHTPGSALLHGCWWTGGGHHWHHWQADCQYLRGVTTLTMRGWRTGSLHLSQLDCHAPPELSGSRF